MIPYTLNLTNCTADTNYLDSLTASDTANFVLTAVSGAYFSSSNRPTLVGTRLDNSTYTLTLNLRNSNTEAYINNIPMSNLQSYVLNGNAIKNLIEFDNNLNNCTSTNDFENIGELDTVNFELIADSGYIFEVAPVLQISIAGSGITELNFTITENSTKAVLTVDFSEYEDILICGIVATADPSVNYRNYGSINVYNVDFNILNSFAALRYVNETQTGYNVLKDYADYVISLNRFYFPITNTLPNVIKLANYDTNINANTPLNDIITLDFGNVTIPQYNADICDYETEIKLLIPFYGFYNISNDYIGKTIFLIFDVNIINGKGIAKLICDNIIFDCINIEPCTEVLFKPKINMNINTENLNARNLYGLTPYLYVKYFDSENQNIYNVDNERKILNEVNGFAKVNEIILNQSILTAAQFITDSEKTELLNILQNGVYFNQ